MGWVNENCVARAFQRKFRLPGRRSSFMPMYQLGLMTVSGAERLNSESVEYDRVVADLASWYIHSQQPRKLVIFVIENFDAMQVTSPGDVIGPIRPTSPLPCSPCRPFKQLPCTHGHFFFRAITSWWESSFLVPAFQSWRKE